MKTINSTRIENDYQALRALCEELDDQYRESPDPDVGYKVGHYDDERLEVQFYDVDADKVVDLSRKLGKFTTYELYTTPISDKKRLVMVRPRL